MKTRNLSLLLGLLTAFTGCNPKSVNTVGPANPVGQRQMIDDKRVVTDSNLNRNVRIVGLNEAVEPGGLLRVQVEVLNTTRSLKLFTCRFEWFDAKGMQVSVPQSTAVARQIEGGESLFLSAVAPSPEVKDFRIKFLETVR